jgi:hypothetical protein
MQLTPGHNSACRQREKLQFVVGCLIAGLICVLARPAAGADIPSSSTPLERGFHLLYDLDFEHAQQEFSGWQQQHNDDPMGPASEAAGLLFSEFNRLGVLEAQFYTKDSTFNARPKLSPDPALRGRFDAVLLRAEEEARKRLAKDPKDRDALFAMTMAAGLRADYAALIDKRNLASLHYSRDAQNWAQQLLAVDPQCYDAYLAIGISKYLIGSVSAPVRWILRVSGFNGSKEGGIADLQRTADRGHYLAPFAQILLAIAYVREDDKPHARQLLASLEQEFPANPLFPREITRLDSGH